MKRVWFAIATTVLAVVSIGAQSVTMTVAYEDKEQPPYYMGNTGDVLASKPGVAVEMVQALERKIPGLKIKLERAPWKRCTTGLGANTYDGIFNASYSTERLAIGWYPTTDGKRDGPVDVSRRITTISYSLYAARETPIPWDGKKFTAFSGTVGAPLGYSIVNDLKALGVTVAEVPGTSNALQMAANGRLTAVALQDVSADDLLLKYPEKFGSLRKVEPPIASKPYYLMLSDAFVRKNPVLANRIWAELRETREKDFKRLVAQYSE